MTTVLWLTVALPLAGAAILLLGRHATDAWGHLLGCATVIGSFVCGTALFAHLVGLPADDRLVAHTLFSWVPVGVLRVDFGLQFDALSACFVLLITGVASWLKVRKDPTAIAHAGRITGGDHGDDEAGPTG